MRSALQLGMLNWHWETLVSIDDPTLRRTLAASLAAKGFRVRVRPEGEEVLRALMDQPAGMVLLDLSAPAFGGASVCRQIRAYDARIGIIFVSNSGSADDIIEALDIGADDFVTQPFQVGELVARLRAVQRRRRQTQPAPQPRLYRAGCLELDMDGRKVKKAGTEIRLTPKEFDLLAVLMRNLGAPVPHRKLLQSVWGPEYGDETEYLRSYVKMLRKKIEDDPREPRYILTEPWSGYRLQVAPTAPASLA